MNANQADFAWGGCCWPAQDLQLNTVRMWNRENFRICTAPNLRIQAPRFPGGKNCKGRHTLDAACCKV
eukprot:CAMPEP_0181511950 /NCGR_PEP_ID=MMETSP1110-20121109/61707_2 /TAXON_ID=174948 /ORGANISM="Symbiodinium sp., Strain CCMP421" /LENGTH=67 /DNA_ID=CAMNT_0023641721 /DNA_START=396 /DNA_END=596 /DNA_ORIENTATION=-